MKMGEKNRIDSANGHPHAPEIARAIRTHVYNKQSIPGHHRDAGSRCFGRGQRSACSAKCHVQAVDKIFGDVGAKAILQRLLQDYRYYRNALAVENPAECQQDNNKTK